MQWLALRATGDTVTRTSKALIRIRSTQLTEEGKQDLLKKTRVLTREANGLHNTSLKAADALPLQKLRELVTAAKRLPYIPPVERAALEALVIAFSTLSRTGEILAPTTADVKEDGTEISIRAKMDASTGKRHLKAVQDAAGLCPATMLRVRRRAAMGRGSQLLFPSTWHKGK